MFDIFGYFDQTIQGADILANSDAHHKYKVVMPDWYDRPGPLGCPDWKPATHQSRCDGAIGDGS